MHQKTISNHGEPVAKASPKGMGKETMKAIKFNECKSYEDIENTIQNALQYDTVVENEAAAQQWFKDAGFDGEVISHDIVNTRVIIWNEEMQGEEEYTVRVYEHYVDSGSVDYVYSYTID